MACRAFVFAEIPPAVGLLLRGEKGERLAHRRLGLRRAAELGHDFGIRERPFAQRVKHAQLVLDEQLEGRVARDVGGVNVEVHLAVGDVLQQRGRSFLFAEAHGPVRTVRGKVKHQPVGRGRGIGLVERRVDPLGQRHRPRVFGAVPFRDPDVVAAASAGPVAGKEKQLAVAAQSRGGFVELAV